MTAHREFLARPWFRELDGLRGFAVLLVVTVHLYSHKEAWAWLAGDRGVTLFFALSGLLITTLGLREEDKRGKLALGGFFLRRAFRLFPLYFVVLAVYAGWVLLLGKGTAEQQSALSEALPWYALYLQEVPFFRILVQQQRDLPFFQTWSLGVEEKFYLIWPLLAFVPGVRGDVSPPGEGRKARLRWTTVFVAALTVALPLMAWLLPSTQQLARYLACYQAILAGCLLALLLHRADGFDALSRWGRTWAALLALLVLHALSTSTGPAAILVGVLYPLAACVVFAGLMAGEGPLAPVMRWSPLVGLGQLSYGVYLVHLLAMAAVYRLFPIGAWSMAGSVFGYLLVVGVSVAIAWPLHRIVEKPMIALGRWLTATSAAAAAMPPRTGQVRRQRRERSRLSPCRMV